MVSKGLFWLLRCWRLYAHFLGETFSAGEFFTAWNQPTYISSCASQSTSSEAIADYLVELFRPATHDQELHEFFEAAVNRFTVMLGSGLYPFCFEDCTRLGFLFAKCAHAIPIIPSLLMSLCCEHTHNLCNASHIDSHCWVLINHPWVDGHWSVQQRMSYSPIWQWESIYQFAKRKMLQPWLKTM